MSDLVYPDAFIRRVLDQTSTIAMVGASANWVRPSNFAMKYLQQKGYRVVPVNPGNVGNEIHGETCYAGLVDVPAPFEMVDIFRRPEDVSGIVDEAISLKDEKGIRVIWMQIGVIDEDAAARAEAADLKVIMDRCPKIEFGRLNHELSWCGINSGVISSKRPRFVR
ncbi:MAG TPA: CoA-binding protein [Rhodospirillaceae bacterium]|nr:CoA-binding protein [Rhodospirillaceae bacterium]|tara:strand:- start:59 stop:556 length:498 start_codon:yes stop_codon:yes gene_type:complete